MTPRKLARTLAYLDYRIARVRADIEWEHNHRRRRGNR